MSSEPPALLIVANSGRAMAESAVRGGFSVAVLDGFCDRDTRALGPCGRLPGAAGGLDPERLLERAARIVPGRGELAVVYGAGLEHAPATLVRLAEGRHLCGNRAEVLDLLRDARRFFSLLDSLAIPYPEIRFEPSAGTAGPWLLKRTGSSGGQGVGYWRDGQVLPAAHGYLQRHLDGPVMSALFIAAASDFRVIGFNRLGLLDAPREERPFLYAGAVSHAPLSVEQRHAVEGYVRALVRELGLRGVNSLDFVLHRGQPRVLELNPRPSATLELYEQSVADGWMKKHVQACRGGLPDDLPVDGTGEVCGHRVCYAGADLRVPHHVRWPHGAKDLPSTGDHIASGQPLCSLFARGATTAGVEARLRQRRRELDRMVASWRRHAAGQAQI